MRWLTLIVAIGALANAQAAAQQAEAKVHIDLGTADGPPGRTLSVPLNIAIPEGMKVTEFELTVRFEKDLLTFTRAELAPQGKTDEVKLTTAVEDDLEKKTGSILKITAVGGQPLGSGAIADLFFRINPKAKPPKGSTGHKAAKFTTTLKKEARIKVGEGQMLAAGGRDGEIDITQGVAIFGCFFYMH
jgi:hypothetical protein